MSLAEAVDQTSRAGNSPVDGNVPPDCLHETSQKLVIRPRLSLPSPLAVHLGDPPQAIPEVEEQFPVACCPALVKPLPLERSLYRCTAVRSPFQSKLKMVLESQPVNDPYHQSIKGLSLSNLARVDRAVLKFDYARAWACPPCGVNVRSVFSNHDFTAPLVESILPVDMPLRFGFILRVALPSGAVCPMPNIDLSAF